jgi:hypothetical protein
VIQLHGLAIVKEVNVGLDTLSPIDATHAALNEHGMVPWTKGKDVNFELATEESKHILGQIEDGFRVEAGSDKADTYLGVRIRRLFVSKPLAIVVDVVG